MSIAANVPDDWGNYWCRCSHCGARWHASEGSGCERCADELEALREEYKQRWPNACPRCFGTGQIVDKYGEVTSEECDQRDRYDETCHRCGVDMAGFTQWDYCLCAGKRDDEYPQELEERW